jgi:hypothetical protein
MKIDEDILYFVEIEYDDITSGMAVIEYIRRIV